MDDVPTPGTPTITVDASNEVVPPDSGTSVGVGGQGFAPSSEVRILVQNTLHAQATVGDDGTFFWSDMLKPQLHLGASVGAVVTAADGTTVRGSGEVFRGEGEDGGR